MRSNIGHIPAIEAAGVELVALGGSGHLASLGKLTALAEFQLFPHSLSEIGHQQFGGLEMASYYRHGWPDPPESRANWASIGSGLSLNRLRFGMEFNLIGPIGSIWTN